MKLKDLLWGTPALWLQATIFFIRFHNFAVVALCKTDAKEITLLSGLLTTIKQKSHSTTEEALARNIGWISWQR